MYIQELGYMNIQKLRYEYPGTWIYEYLRNLDMYIYIQEFG
jgi:hypothetical protein